MSSACNLNPLPGCAGILRIRFGVLISIIHSPTSFTLVGAHRSPVLINSRPALPTRRSEGSAVASGSLHSGHSEYLCSSDDKFRNTLPHAIT